MLASQAILGLFQRDPVGFLNRLVGSSLAHIYDQETKEQSKEWTQWFPASKDVQDIKSSSKVLAPVFWDKDGMLLVGYPEKSATIMAK
jgi:hypothetical protein